MTRIPHRPVLAAAFALFCAACGGPDTDPQLLAELQADSAFSQPVTIRIPRAIRITASVANAGDGWGNIARFGPEHYRRLHAPMNVLRMAGVLRVNDYSRRELVRRSRLGYTSCVPRPHLYPSGGPGHPSCNRTAETRIYDYSHRVQVNPTAALGAEWREDTEPWGPVVNAGGAEFSPGWVVELGRREIVKVGKSRNPELGIREVGYTWRWILTPTGAHFDPNGATLQGLPASMRTLSIARMSEGPRADTVYTGKAILARIEGAWKVTEVRL
jgi:hypothetical protein